MGNKIVLRSTSGAVAVSSAISTGAQGADGPSSGGAVSSVNGQTGAVTLTAASVAETSTKKIMTDTERTKLSGIASGATANSSDATLLDLGNATGTLGLARLPGSVLLVATYSGGTAIRPIAGSGYTVLWVCDDAADAAALPLVTSGTAGRYANDIITTKA